MKTALIVIDAQKGFITQNTRSLPAEIAEHIQTNQYDFVLFTQFINVEESNFVKQLSWKRFFEPPETDIVNELASFLNHKNLFIKNTHSAIKSISLVRFLDENKIGRLVLCGVDTDSCVLATAIEAFNLGFEIHVLTGLCGATKGSEFNNAALKIIEKNITKS